MALTTMMLGRIRGRIHHVRHLFNQYFDTMESMERLWEFYCAPETQTGLVHRTEADNTKEGDIAVSIKGHFSWGITPKLERADKDKIKEKLKKKAYKKKTKEMNKVHKFFFDMMPESREKYRVPLADRTLEQMINLKSIDL